MLLQEASGTLLFSRCFPVYSGGKKEYDGLSPGVERIGVEQGENKERLFFHPGVHFKMMW